MKYYLSHTEYPIWEVIQKGNGPVSVSTDTNGVIKVLPPKTAEEILARERERKARTTLLIDLPEDHLAKFHKMTDAKEMWDAIKSRFEGLHKGYDRFQSLLNQLEIHGVGVSTKDANQKFLSSLPSSWSQNVAFISSESTSSTNDGSTAYGVSTSSDYNSQRENSSSYTDELMYSFFANQSSGPQLDHEDLEHLDEFDLEEMDLKWQVAMISMRLKKFYKKTDRRLQFDAKGPVGFNKTKVECFNFHKSGHFARECKSKGNQESRRRDARNTGYKAKDNRRRPRKQEEPKALVTLDGEGLDTEVTSCSKECVESYAKLKKLYNEQREQLGDASIEIQAYTQDLAKISAKDKSGLGFENIEGMHAVPPLMTGNYIPSGPDREVHDSMFTYGPKQSKTSESDTQTSNFDSCKSNSSVETLESVPEPVIVEPKVLSQPKVWSDAPIIEEFESDSDDEYVIEPSNKIEKNLVNAARQNPSSQAAETSTARKIKRPFNKSTAPKANFTNHKVNTARDKTVSAVRGYRETAVKTTADVVDKKNKVSSSKTLMSKGIKREYSNARTPQQNRVAERKNMTLIEAARTMLEYSFLPNTFWAEAVSTACYVHK
ncbi:ribonuclease H-like domain-containing protein [Tanacetum coccineum]